MDGQSEFNMAVSFLGRLDYLLWAANSHAEGCNASGWFNDLNTLRRELNNFTDKESREKLIDIKNKIAPEIIKNNRQAMRGMSSIPEGLYDLFEEYELILRSILKSSGLETKMTKDYFKPENW